MEKNKYSKAILFITASVIIYYAPQFLYRLLAIVLFVLGVNEFLKAKGINVLKTIKSDKFKENIGSTIKNVKDKSISLTSDLVENTKHNKNTKKMKKVIFAIIGAILGLPLSYYFQPEMVQGKIGGISGYIKHFGEILEHSDLLGNVITGVIVCALIGFVIGYFMDKNEVEKTN